jgi:hypothetical protein
MVNRQTVCIAEPGRRTYNEAVMRVFIGCFLVVLASLATAPDSQELHNRYGEPTMERFKARPGISVAVEYGPDRLACVLLIEPPQSVLHQAEQLPLMPAEGVSEVLEEIVPAAIRGKEVTSATFQSGCNVSLLTEYENVFIMRTTHTCDASSKDQDVRTTVRLKRGVCLKNEPSTISQKQLH